MKNYNNSFEIYIEGQYIFVILGISIFTQIYEYICCNYVIHILWFTTLHKYMDTYVVIM